MREALDESGIYVDWDKSESHQMQKQQCMFRKEGETLSRESLIAVLTSLLKWNEKIPFFGFGVIAVSSSPAPAVLSFRNRVGAS
jgi:hypothetical protein